MKLSQITEGLLSNTPLDVSPSNIEQNHIAQKVAGDDGEAATQVKNSMQQKADVDKKMNPKNNIKIKQTLQKLGNTQWNPKNQTFSRAAGELLGTMKN